MHIQVSIQRYCAPAQRLVMADASAAGALITGAFSNIAKGDEVILGLSGSSLVATVAWVAEGSFGLVFHRRLAEHELDAAINPPTRSIVGSGARTIEPASLA